MTEKVEKILIALSILSLIMAIAAGTVATLNLDSVSKARSDARRDTCQLFRGLVYAATAKAPKARAGAVAYINRTELANCNVYARTDK